MYIFPIFGVYPRSMNEDLKTIGRITLFYFVLWVLLMPWIRIGLPSLALLSLLISAVINDKILIKKPMNILVLSMLVLWLITSFISQIRFTGEKFYVVFGLQDQFEYINTIGPKARYKFYHYPALTFMNNNIPEHAKVLLWSNDGYYLDREYLYAVQLIKRMADGNDLYNPKNVIKELKRFGITHVAMTDNYLRKPLRTSLEDNGTLEIIYYDKYMKIGALP